jgi:hypothetical protein
MIYLHYLHYVSQGLAEEAMKRLDGLTSIKKMQVLDMPSSWTLQIQTEGSLNTTICQFLSQELNPMIPIWNRPGPPPIAMTHFGTRENMKSSARSGLRDSPS